MVRKVQNKLLSTLLAITMVLSLLPRTALAAGGAVTVMYSGTLVEDALDEAKGEYNELTLDWLFPKADGFEEMYEGSAAYGIMVKKHESGTPITLAKPGNTSFESENYTFTLAGYQYRFGGNAAPTITCLIDDSSNPAWESGETDTLSSEGIQDYDFIYYLWKAEPKVGGSEVFYDFNLPSKDDVTANAYYVWNVGFLTLHVAEAPFNEDYIDGDTLSSLKTTGKLVATGEEIPFWPEGLRAGSGSSTFLGIVGGIPTVENGSDIETFYRFLGWEDENGTLYKEGDSMPIMGSEEIRLTAQWEEVNLAEIELTPEQESLEIPFAVEETLTFEDGTEEVVDAKISQHSSKEGAEWSQDNKSAPLSLEDDRVVYYKAELYMNDLIAGNGEVGGSHGKDMLANRNIQNKEFAGFEIEVNLDDHLQVVDEDGDGNVEFTFTCAFLRPLEGGYRITSSDETAIDCTVTEESVSATVSPTSGIVLDGKKIAGQSVQSTAYTYAVDAESLESLLDNKFVLHVEWKPGQYSYQELLSEISLEVAAAKIEDSYGNAVETTGVITGHIDLNMANISGVSESELGPILVLGDKDWGIAFGHDYAPDEVTVEDIFAMNKVVKEQLDAITLNANTVYAKLPSYDITINYLDKGTNEEIADTVTLPDRAPNTAVDLSEHLHKDIPGYVWESTDVATNNATIENGARLGKTLRFMGWRN